MISKDKAKAWIIENLLGSNGTNYESPDDASLFIDACLDAAGEKK